MNIVGVVIIAEYTKGQAVLIDGNSLLINCYNNVLLDNVESPEYKAQEKKCILKFFEMFRLLLIDFNPEYLAVIWGDVKASMWQLHEGYDVSIEQSVEKSCSILINILKEIDVKQVKIKGYQPHDIINTLITVFEEKEILFMSANSALTPLVSKNIKMIYLCDFLRACVGKLKIDETSIYHGLAIVIDEQYIDKYEMHDIRQEKFKEIDEDGILIENFARKIMWPEACEIIKGHGIPVPNDLDLEKRYNLEWDALGLTYEEKNENIEFARFVARYIRRYTENKIQIGEPFEGSTVTELQVKITNVMDKNIIDVIVVTEHKAYSLLYDICELRTSNAV